MRNQRRQVIRIVIHVVAIAGLSRPAVAAPVMSYDAIAVVEEEQHLRVPIVGRQRPTMAEHDRLTLAPILVENLDAVFLLMVFIWMTSSFSPVLFNRWKLAPTNGPLAFTAPDREAISAHCWRKASAC